MFDVWAFIGYLDNAFLLRGVAVTVGLTAVSLGCGLVLGAVLAVMRASPGPVLPRVAKVYVWVFRGTPLIVQLVIVYTGLPQVGLKFGVVLSACIALTLNEAAYLQRDHPRRVLRRGGRAAGRGARRWDCARGSPSGW